MGIIKDSKTLKKALIDRLKEVAPNKLGTGIKNADIVNDAKERGFNISSDVLSRYLSDKPQKSALSESQIIWLAIRYGIPVQLSIGNPVIVEEEGKNVIAYEIPKYHEATCLKRLKMIFKDA